MIRSGLGWVIRRPRGVSKACSFFATTGPHQTGAGHVKHAVRPLRPSHQGEKGFGKEWRSERRTHSGSTIVRGASGTLSAWPPSGQQQGQQGQGQQQPMMMTSEFSKAVRASVGATSPAALDLGSTASSSSLAASPCPWLDLPRCRTTLRHATLAAPSRDPARCKSTSSWSSSHGSSSSSPSPSRLPSSPDAKLRHLEEELRSKLDIDTATSEHWDPFHDRDEGLVLLNASGELSRADVCLLSCPRPPAICFLIRSGPANTRRFFSPQIVMHVLSASADFMLRFCARPLHQLAQHMPCSTGTHLEPSLACVWVLRV